MRKTEMPPREGCRQGRSFLGRPRHDWRYSTQWNGNNRGVLPFTSYPNGIARAGWRCYCCGRFEWDESDRSFAINYALAMGMVKMPDPL